MAEVFISKEIIADMLKNDVITQDEVNMLYKEDLSVIQQIKILSKKYLDCLQSNNEASEKEAYMLGANIIFNLRKLTVGKDITMLLGATAPDNTRLRTKEIPLTDLLNDVNNYKITKNALELHSAIEKWENMASNRQAQRNAVWKKILDSSQLSGQRNKDFTTKQADGFVPRRGDKPREVYRRMNPDTFVYYGYAGDKKEGNIYSYYKPDGSSYFQFFNRGWLFEHFQNKWRNADRLEKDKIIAISNTDHPVQIAIDKTDSIEGVKGGDFRAGNKDYQAKFGNQQIITLKSIQETMNSIIKIINEYDATIRKGKKEITRNLVKLFTDSRNLDIEGANIKEINKKYEEIVDNLVKKAINKI